MKALADGRQDRRAVGSWQWAVDSSQVEFSYCPLSSALCPLGFLGINLAAGGALWLKNGGWG
jgi:hypothetical protein